MFTTFKHFEALLSEVQPTKHYLCILLQKICATKKNTKAFLIRTNPTHKVTEYYHPPFLCTQQPSLSPSLPFASRNALCAEKIKVGFGRQYRNGGAWSSVINNKDFYFPIFYEWRGIDAEYCIFGPTLKIAYILTAYISRMPVYYIYHY